MLSDLHYQILKTVSEHSFISGNELNALFHDDIFLADDPVSFLIDSGYLGFSPAQSIEHYSHSAEPFLRRKGFEYDYDPCYHLWLTNSGLTILDTFLRSESVRADFGNQVKHINSIAESSEQRSSLALKTSKKADIKGWLSVTFAGLAVLFEFILHHNEILSFFSVFL